MYVLPSEFVQLLPGIYWSDHCMLYLVEQFAIRAVPAKYGGEMDTSGLVRAWISIFRLCVACELFFFTTVDPFFFHDRSSMMFGRSFECLASVARCCSTERCRFMYLYDVEEVSHVQEKEVSGGFVPSILMYSSFCFIVGPATLDDVVLIIYISPCVMYF